MAPIDLRSAAAHHRDLPHQNAAWQYLQEQIPEAVLAEFAVIFRASGSGALPAPPSSAGGDAIGLALPLIEHFEGMELQSYPDPLSGGDPWTIGIGSTRHLDGTPVRPGDVITEEQARKMLLCYAKECEATQRRRIPTWGAMTPYQQAALIGYAFNLGSSWYGSHGFATLTRIVRDAEWAAVPEALLLYVNPGSSVEAGLRRRRQAEGQLWSTGRWDMG
jgi:GH24 family phage-related lysozyme (muramidase)